MSGIDGSTLRTLRLGHGISLRQLAREAGVSHSHLSKMEAGEVGRLLRWLLDQNNDTGQPDLAGGVLADIAEQHHRLGHDADCEWIAQLGRWTNGLATRPAGGYPELTLRASADRRVTDTRARHDLEVSVEFNAFDEQPPPGVPGYERHPAHVPAACSYRAGEPVWVYRHGAWHRGVVEGSSPLAVLVRYWPAGQRGEVTDTVTAEHVAPLVSTREDRR